MKKGFLGITAIAMALMTGSLSTSNTSTVNVKSNEISSNNDKSSSSQNQPIKNEKLNYKSNFEKAKKGNVLRYYQNVGIPPKTYGMHYVKRNTHKRTNI